MQDDAVKFRLGRLDDEIEQKAALTARVQQLEAALREIADGGHGHKVCAQIARAAIEAVSTSPLVKISKERVARDIANMRAAIEAAKEGK